MHYPDLLYRSVNHNNTRAMRLAHGMSRSLLCVVVMAILLLPGSCALAVDQASGDSVPSNAGIQGVVFTPAKLVFGKVGVGRRKVQTVTLTNWGNSDLTLLQVSTQGIGFTLSGMDLPISLARGERFTFSCAFAPASARGSSGSVSFISGVSDVSKGSNPILMLELNGTGSDNGQLIVSPATMNFGTVRVGSGATQPGTLTAYGDEVTICSAKTSGSEYTLTGVTFPLTIPAGSSQGFLITFAPQTSGAASATISFMDATGSDPLAVESLSGVGTVTQGHSVGLSWNASNSQDVIGYNVYRSLTSGGPYGKINSVLDQSTNYTDTTVISGNTYYYVATAVNSSDEESAYSNQAQAAVP
jgi:hypothetical protein